MHPRIEHPGLLGDSERDLGVGLEPAHRLERRDALARGQFGNRLEGLRADPARRRADHPFEADGVGRIGEHAQVGEQVLDVALFVKAHAADDVVGDSPAHERLFDRARLSVDAVEDDDVGGSEAARAGQPRDLERDKVGLVALGDAGEVGDRLAGAVFGPQVFDLAFGVVADDGAGRGEDGLGRAVVLLELENLRGRVVALEIEDVADVGAAPAVDRLVLVADHAQISRSRGERLHDQVLDAVGVLVLVDQQMRRAPLPSLEDFRKALEQQPGLQLQIAEVHRVHRAHPLLVEPVDLRDRGLAPGLSAREHLLGRDRLVLGLLDSRARKFERRRVGQRGVVEHAANRGQRIAFVEDREIAIVAERVTFLAQDSRARGMKGADPRQARVVADQRRDPLAHLVGGLVGEGDRQHLGGRRLALGQDVGDTVGQHAGLARARAGEDEDRAVGREHSGALFGIQIVELHGDRRSFKTSGRSTSR